LQAYLAFETLDRLESMDCTLLTIMQEITDARGGLHLLAEEARQQYAAGETEEGGFAVEEKEQ